MTAIIRYEHLDRIAHVAWRMHRRRTSQRGGNHNQPAQPQCASSGLPGTRAASAALSIHSAAAASIPSASDSATGAVSFSDRTASIIDVDGGWYPVIRRLRNASGCS